jgi:hypothetical protein
MILYENFLARFLAFGVSGLQELKFSLTLEHLDEAKKLKIN